MISKSDILSLLDDAFPEFEAGRRRLVEKYLLTNPFHIQILLEADAKNLLAKVAEDRASTFFKNPAGYHGDPETIRLAMGLLDAAIIPLLVKKIKEEANGRNDY